MKASRFVKAFEHEVDRWERTLSLIMEIMEMLLIVQRQWMYLEVRLYLSTSLSLSLSLSVLTAFTSWTSVSQYQNVSILILLALRMMD